MVLAEDLRQAVLQAALQGKLTEQLETDSDVDEFIVQIKRTKKELADAKEIKREANISDVSEDETPCNIPNNWRFERLGNLFYIERGASPRPISAYITTENDGVNWVKIGDTEVGGKYVNFTKEKITKEGAEKSRAVKVGDFIFSNSMSFGRPYIMNIDGCIHDGWNVIHNIHSVDNAMKEFNQDYLYFVLSSTMLKQQIIDKAEGGVVKNIRSDNLRDLVMPVPPIEEQQRIVDKINEIMPKIDEYEKIEKELEALKKEFPTNMKNALLQAAMQGKLTEQFEGDSSVDEFIRDEEIDILDEDDYPYFVPDNWRFTELGNLTSIPIKRGKSPKYADKSGVLVFAQKCNQKNGSISLHDAKYLDENMKHKYEQDNYLQEDDIVINSTGGGTLGRIGYISEELIKGSLPIVPDSHVTTIRTKVNVLPRYIYFFLKFNQPYLETMGVGSTNQTELRPDTIKELAVPLPPMEEQQRIVERLDALLPLCEDLKE